MKSTITLLSIIAILCMAAACKKKDSTPAVVVTPVTPVTPIDSPVIITTDTITTVTDTYTGTVKDIGDNNYAEYKTMSFYITYAQGGNKGLSVITCSTNSLQLGYTKYTGYWNSLADTIYYTGAGIYQDSIAPYYNVALFSIGNGKLGDSLAVQWTYPRLVPEGDDHRCTFSGSRVK